MNHLAVVFPEYTISYYERKDIIKYITLSKAGLTIQYYLNYDLEIKEASWPKYDYDIQLLIRQSKLRNDFIYGDMKVCT